METKQTLKEKLKGGLLAKVEAKIREELGYLPKLVLNECKGNVIYLLEEEGVDSLTTKLITGNKLLSKIFKSGAIWCRLTDDNEDAREIRVSIHISYTHPTHAHNGVELVRTNVEY